VLVRKYIKNRNCSTPSIFQDRYVLMSMVFSGCITFWHAILARFYYNSELQRNLDFWAFLIFITAYFVFNLVYIVIIVIQVRVFMLLYHGRETM